MSTRVRLLAAAVVAVVASGVTAAALRHPHAVQASSSRPAPAPAAVPAQQPEVPALPRVTRPKPRPKPRLAAKPAARKPVAKPKPATKPRPRPETKPKPKPRPVRTESAQQRGQRVLTSLHYDWQRLGYRIVFLPERRGYLGYTDGATKTITIWVRTRETDVVLAHTIAHELGHALDFAHNNAAKHAAYLTLRGINPTTDWYGCNGCTDYRSPAGDWAEVFAYWLAGPGDFRSQMGPPPDKAHMAAISQLYTY